VRRRTWFLATLALALLAGGCEKKRGTRAEVDLYMAAHRGDVQKIQSLIAEGVSVHTVGYWGSTALHVAAEEGHLRVAELLIHCGAHVDCLDRQGRTPLHVAATGGRLEVVRLLIHYGARTNTVDDSHQTPATSAMLHDHREVVELLVAEGADIPLHLAAYVGDVERVRALLDSGTDVNTRDPHGWTPLHCAISQNQVAVARLLVARGADPDAVAEDEGFNRNHVSGTALYRAIAVSHSDLVELLIDGGADINAPDRYGRTPLWSAARRGQSEIVRLLIAKGADANVQGGDNYFCEGIPLGAAIAEGHLDAVDALVAGGADVNAKGESGWTLLHVAVTSYYSSAVEAALPMARPDAGTPQEDWDRYATSARQLREATMVRMIQLLIAHGANVNTGDDEGITPLHCAAYHAYADVAGLLIAHGADVNAKSVRDPTPDGIMWEWDRGFRMEPGVTPLHEAVAGWDPNVTDVFVTHGAEVNVADESGRTPLHYAAGRASVRIIGLLIAQGADVNAVDDSGETPLVVALRTARVNTAKSLIAAGADKVVMRDHPGRRWYLEEGLEREPLLHRACRGGYMVKGPAANDGEPNLANYRREWMELLLANGADPNERDEKGNTPLHAAVLASDETSVRLLIDHGADVRATNQTNATPLHYAASNNQKELADLLLMKGADVNARDTDGDTPLHSAALRGHKEVVGLLLDHGADGSVKNSRGRTPLDEAVRRGHQDVIQVLRAKQGAKQGLPGESEK